MTLLITPTVMFLLTFLILDKDVRLVIYTWVAIYLTDIIVWLLIGQDFYYIRSAITDVCMFMTVFLLKDDLKAMLIGVICFTSFGMNIYENWSYYQTWYYPYRDGIQWVLTQAICVSILVNCRWRQLCSKTKTLK